MGEFKLELRSGNTQFRSKSAIFCPPWPWNFMDVLAKLHSTSSLHRLALCIISKPWVNSNWSYTLETLNSGQNRIFLSCVTLKFNGWPWKTTEHLLYTILSIVHYFKAIGKFQLDLQSRNAQFGSKSTIFCPVWPRNLTDDLKNYNRAALLYCFKLCASFHSHQSIQTGVTVRKRLVWVKIDVFLSRETLKFNRWPWKTIGSLFSATTSFVYHFIAIGEFKLELQSGNEKFGSKSMIFLILWNLTVDFEKQ